MGGGNWSAPVYRSNTQKKIDDDGTVFGYSQKAKQSGVYQAHATLDPKQQNKNGANAGKITREALDNADHPESLAIAILFDVTGSMGQIPVTLQQKLPQLHGLLMRKGYVTDPQILFGAIGDSYSDRVPLQVSQFEADNRMDEHLANIFLEGNGGGQMRESYGLGAYFLARHTQIDCWDKRGKKGYAFIIGDERPHQRVEGHHIQDSIGDAEASTVTIEAAIKELQERYEVFFLFAKQGSYSEAQILPEWKALLGERAIVLDDADAVCEAIALTIGLTEGVIDLDQGLQDLKDVGADLSAIHATGKALATVGAGAGSGGKSVVPSGDLDFGTGASKTERI